jgi:hypothetical protein
MGMASVVCTICGGGFVTTSSPPYRRISSIYATNDTDVPCLGHSSGAKEVAQHIREAAADEQRGDRLGHRRLGRPCDHRTHRKGNCPYR